MLQELHVRGLGVLSDATVSFAPGLNVVSGETGAGKTLLVTSLALLCGARAESRLVAAGAKDALVEAVLCPTPALRELLSGKGLDADDPGHHDDDVTVVRRIGADGRSRAWLAGQLVPASTLAEAGRLAVEIHGQGDAFALARPQVQLDALDSFAGSLPLRREYAAALDAVRRLEGELAELARQERERARTVDTLSHQLAEIDRARLEEAEEDRIAADLARLEHAERLTELGSAAAAAAGPDAAAGALGEAAKALQEAAGIDGTVAGLAARASALAAEAADVAAEARSWRDSIDADPERLAALQERAAAVGRLRRKYGETVAEVLRFAEECRARLDELTSADDRVQAIQGRLPEAVRVLDQAAGRLSAVRREAATRLEELVRAELPSLALGSAAFEAVCEPAEQDAEHGRDRVELRFSANPSTPPQPVGKASSGGELSRVMIALTLALASAHEVPVIVLDEADQGVGGEAALELARRVKRLGATHQVLVVTHLPQIAAFADHHLVVSRSSGTVTVRPVTGDERLAEISRMLAGLGSSDRARAHAAELLELGAARNGRARAARVRR